MILTYVLVVQGILQAFLLLVVFRRLVRREDADAGPGGGLVMAILISLGTVLIEAFLIRRAWGLTLVPILTLIVVLLARHSWTAMRHAMVIVLVLSSVSIFLHWEVERALHPPPPRRVASQRTAGDATDVLRYQQIANAMAFAPTNAPARPTPAPLPATNASAPPEPPPNPTNWVAAFREVDVGGTMMLQNGQRVAFVNHRMVQESNVVSATYRDRVYRWRIKAVTGQGVEWEPLDVKDMPGTPRPPDPPLTNAAPPAAEQAPALPSDRSGLAPSAAVDSAVDSG